MEKENNSKSELVSINLLPVAILLAAIIISGTILYSQGGKKQSDGNTTVSESESGDTAGTQTQDTEFPSAQSSINDDPYLGDKGTATVAVVEFSEYQCGYCKRHTDETLPQLIKEYVDTGKIIYVFRDFQMYGEVSEATAKIGTCIYQKEAISKFQDYHKRAFGISDIDSVYDLVSDLGLDVDEIKKCSEQDSLSDDLKKDMEDGQAAGITGTPGFVVGKLDKDGNVDGKLIAGAYPFTNFQEIIEEYLK